MKKKVLIIGNSAKEYALAKNISTNYTVYMLPANDLVKDFATSVDIRENSVYEILEFVIKNNIDITIPISEKSLKTDIVEVFNENKIPIFGPNIDITETIFDKCFLKKILYKLKIPTPKFGIFEKQNLALDYIKNIRLPFVVKTNESSSAVILTSQNTIKPVIDSYFINKEQKILIEDYIWGTPFSFYVLTDGYEAASLGSSIHYKHSLDGNGGQLTTGMGACAPNYKLSFEKENYIMTEIIYPLLNYFKAQGTPYLGILGLDAILTDDNEILVLGLKTFMQDSDAVGILELIDTDLILLFRSCLLGYFSDEVASIPYKNLSTTSVVLTCKNKNNIENIINGIEDLDDDIVLTFYPQTKKNKYLEYEVDYGQSLIITGIGRTAYSATNKAYKNVSKINFKGIHYRKDICLSTTHI